MGGAVAAVVETVEKTVSDVGKTVEKTVEAVVKNPLPVIETVALTAVGVPAPVASAAVSAANGGSIENIAKSAIGSYVGGEVGGTTGAAASDAGASATLANIAGSAAGSAASTLVKGGNLDNAFANAVIGASGSAILDATKAEPELTQTPAEAATPPVEGSPPAPAVAEAPSDFQQLTPEQIAAAVQPVSDIVANAPEGVQLAQAPSQVLSDAAGSFPIRDGVIDLGEVTTKELPEGETTSTLPGVEVTGQAPTDAQIIDLISKDTGAAGPLPTAGPSPVTPPAGGSPTLPQVDVSAQEEPVVTDTVAPTTTAPAPDYTDIGTVTATAPPAESPTLPETTVSATREEPVITDATDIGTVTATAPREAPTLPEVTVTPDEEEAVVEDAVVAEAPPEETPVEETPTEPYKPELYIFGGAKPKRTARSVLSTPLSGIYKSPLEQALTSFVPAGEITGDPSGKKRENVWNEASLRLKDALGL